MTNQTAMPELLPCPFCGGNKIEQEENDLCQWFLVCDDCGGRIGNNDGKGAERWNRRALSQQGEPVAWFEKGKNSDAWFLAYTHNPDAETMPLFTAPPQAEAAQAPGKQDGILQGLAEAVQAQSEHGFWRSCSGCYETEDGHPVGKYPHSEALGCSLGGGCSECGGLGAIWWDLSGYSEDDDAAPVQPAQHQEREQKKLDAGDRVILEAGIRSGDIGAATLAAQLAGVPACDRCYFRKEFCKCAAQEKA